MRCRIIDLAGAGLVLAVLAPRLFWRIDRLSACAGRRLRVPPACLGGREP